MSTASTSKDGAKKEQQANAKLEAQILTHRALKGHLTKSIKTADRILQQAQALGPSVALQEQLKSILQAIDNAYKKVEASIDTLILLDEQTELPKYEKAIDDEFNRTNDMVEHVTEQIVIFEKELMPSPRKRLTTDWSADDDKPVNRSKPMDSLKPKTLTREHTPVELTVWIKKFTAFFVGSAFEKATLIEQQAHFNASIDAFLVERLSQLIKPNTPVLPDAADIEKSCIDHLKDVFLIINPLFSRRMDYFGFTQGKNQPFTEWYEKMLKRQDEADLPGLTVADLTAMRCLTGVSDPVLKAEFLKTPTKDAKGFLDVAQNYELGKRYVKSMGNQATALATSTTNTGAKKKTNGQQSTTSGTPNGKSKAKSIYQDGKCFRCGQKVQSRSEHKAECKAKEHTCKKCGKTGHFPSVCLSETTAKKADTNAPAKAANTDTATESVQTTRA